MDKFYRLQATNDTHLCATESGDNVLLIVEHGLLHVHFSITPCEAMKLADALNSAACDVASVAQEELPV